MPQKDGRGRLRDGTHEPSTSHDLAPVSPYVAKETLKMGLWLGPQKREVIWITWSGLL